MRWVRASLFCVSGVCLAAPARAELVRLTGGRTLSVIGHRADGDSVVLTLRGGGEIVCARSLVAEILPDEVPYPEPEPADDLSALGPVLESGPFTGLIAAAAERYGVSPRLLEAVIQVESNFERRARSPKGAMGLMQLMPSTARLYNVRNPYDPRANIAAGVKHLKSLLDRMGGAVELALAAYNAGEGAVKKFNGIPPYRETRDYVSRILSIARPGTR